LNKVEQRSRGELKAAILQVLQNDPDIKALLAEKLPDVQRLLKAKTKDVYDRLARGR
jgi:hypothetical protein